MKKKEERELNLALFGKKSTKKKPPKFLPEMEPGGSGTAGNSSGGAGRRPFNFPGNNSSRNQQQNVGDSSAPSKSNPNLNKAQ